MDCQKLFEAYVNAVRNNFAYEEKLENDVRCNKQSLLLKEVAASGTNRIGYIVTTCSPVTKTHIELGQQAADNLGLGKVIYVIWPFHYIPGFHNLPVEEWVQKEKHIPWNLRVELLERAITDASDSRLSVLRESKEWYIRSGVNWNSDEAQSSFWTGTWYVLRLIQAQIREINPSADLFLFVAQISSIQMLLRKNTVVAQRKCGKTTHWRNNWLFMIFMQFLVGVGRGN